MDETLKSYLVALGFTVNSASYNRFQEALRAADNQIKANTTRWVANFAHAGTAIVSTLATISAATVELLDRTAQADLGYQKFAMRMYMARDAAKQFKIVTDAMGESYTDIAWNPELNQRYKWLMGEASKLQALLPGDAEQQFRRIRDIKAEFTLMKIEMTYGLQLVSLSIAKHLNIPLKEGDSLLRKINDYIQVNMANWADNIALGLVEIWELAEPVGRAIEDVVDALNGLWNAVSPETRGWATAAAGFTAFLFAPGWLKAIMLIGVAVLLIDDFYAYLDGRKSFAAPVWEKVISMFERLRDIIRSTTVWISTLGAYFTKYGFGQGLDVNHKSFLDIKHAVEASYDRLFAGTVLGEGKPSSGAPAPQGNVAGDAMTGFNRMASIESSNNYNAIGPDIVRGGKVDNALGKYQIMRSNWSAWVAEARRAGVKVGDDWRNPANQDAVAQFKWLQYYKQFGNSNYLAAVAWHAGPGVAKKVMVSGDGSFLSGYSDVLGTKTSDYAARIAGHQFYPQTVAPRTPGGGGGNSESNITINLNGMTNEQMVQQIKQTIRAEGYKKTIMENRYPGVPGVAP